MTLVDTNIFLDFVTRDPRWAHLSRKAFVERAARGPILVVDPVFSETSVAFGSAADCASFLDALGVRYEPMAQEALWRAGQAFKLYRARGGSKTNVLVDFFIGAQASVKEVSILTRDSTRYRTYFPEVEILEP
ncbi:MAG: DNA-binding protein [Methylocystaceae bacterium]|nr:MAG: DNA-binding protein [Methylocystaceae bacterium]